MNISNVFYFRRKKKTKKKAKLRILKCTSTSKLETVTLVELLCYYDPMLFHELLKISDVCVLTKKDLVIKAVHFIELFQISYPLILVYNTIVF